jgi:hypothetical protein
VTFGVFFLAHEVAHRCGYRLGGFSGLEELLQGFTLVQGKTENFTDTQNKQRDQESTPNCCKEDNYPTEDRTWVDVSKSDSRHGNHDTISRREKVAEVQLIYR